MSNEGYIPDFDEGPDPDDNSLAAQVARAKAVLKPYEWPNRRVLKSALYEWFPESKYADKVMWEMANALLVNVEDDVERFDGARVERIYKNLGDNAARFCNGEQVSAEDYLDILGIDPAEIAEITLCWQHATDTPGSEEGGNSLSLRTVNRLKWREDSDLCLTDLVYLLVRPYADAISTGDGITYEWLAACMNFPDCVAVDYHGLRVSPLILTKTRARIDLVQFRDFVIISHYQAKKLSKLPLSREGVSSLIDRVSPGPESIQARWLKLCLHPEYPQNLPDFLVGEGMYGQEFMEFCMLTAPILSKRDLVRAELHRWLDEEFTKDD